MYHYHSRHPGSIVYRRRQRGRWFPWWMIFCFFWLGPRILASIQHAIHKLTSGILLTVQSWLAMQWSLSINFSSPSGQWQSTIFHVSFLDLVSAGILIMMALAFMIWWTRYHLSQTLPVAASPSLPAYTQNPMPFRPESLQPPAPQPVIPPAQTFNAPPTRRLDDDSDTNDGFI